MQKVPLIIGLMLFVLGLAVFLYFSANRRVVDPRAGAGGGAAPAAEEKNLEQPMLAAGMGVLQAYTDKLHLAATNGNLELARFYLEKLQEKTDRIRKAGYRVDDLDVGEFLEVMLSPALEEMEEALDEEGDGYAAAHEELLSSCNTCHEAMDHDFIVVAPPGDRPYSNQVFDKP